MDLAEKQEKQKLLNDEIQQIAKKRKHKHSVATEQQKEIEALKETISRTKMEHEKKESEWQKERQASLKKESKLKKELAKKESDWQKEKQTLMQNLNAEREKNRLLEARINELQMTQTSENSGGVIQSQHSICSAGSSQQEKVVFYF